MPHLELPSSVHELGQMLLCCQLRLRFKNEPKTSQGMKTTHQSGSTNPRHEMLPQTGLCRFLFLCNSLCMLQRFYQASCLVQLTALTYFLSLSAPHPWPLLSSQINKIQAWPWVEVFVPFSHCFDWT